MIDPIIFLRAFYLAASALVLFVQAVPVFRDRFLSYGPRASSNSTSSKPKSSPSASIQFLDYLAAFQVPHNYFTHFYVTSVLCSAFWGYHIWQLGTPAESGRLGKSNSHGPTTDDWQTTITWIMMSFQGIRRLLESYHFTSSSKSRMWVVHYVLGLLFYLTINMSIWVETAPMLASKLPVLHAPSSTTSRISTSSQTQSSWRLFIIPLAIFRAQYLQHSYHRYLFDLKKSSSTYQLPSHPSFPNLLCPHYTCEVAIYFFLSLLAAPAGHMVNWTLICATIFVAVNLGVTAQGTKEWYMKTFGAEKVKGRKRMVPGLW